MGARFAPRGARWVAVCARPLGGLQLGASHLAMDGVVGPGVRHQLPPLLQRVQAAALRARHHERLGHH